MDLYSVKILKCEAFLSALRRNSEKEVFYGVNKKLLQPPLCRTLDGPLQPPLNTGIR